MPGVNSVLAEIEAAECVLAERVVHEFSMAARAEIESKTLVGWGLVILRIDGLTSLKELRDRLHGVGIKVVFPDLGWVESGIGLDLDHVTPIPGRGQILSAEITREVDHQRLIPQ